MKLIIALMLVILAGCTTTTGKPLSDSFVNSIEIGETTIAQVKAEFGEPASFSKSANGDRTLNWGYSKVSGIGSVKTEGINVTFDSDGLVKDYKYQAYDI